MVTVQISFETKVDSQVKSRTENFSGINYQMARKEFKKKYPKAKIISEKIISKSTVEEY
ncbi:hypothetical protein YerA41_075 [Yersinia phage YerA41]|uniref:Uncharacterized protein n=1 Tax=Yersinia phage vB_Yru_GN1 TaxID=3074381 RepID=A0AA86MGW9_9CAUD|nr:hypothetical protein YerA41_075 [Yersinia phage YerA41]BES79885.1 hypothetical protein [Yersinia phage vB_Yru_GN1]